ncbi:hypothetical protein AtNW77_Chr1g0008321 [Arabidopsis thaliana]|uniref:Uncharacterized protein n=4 Tax=Arabidopsis TaxID=3701 RepID=A0A654E9T7_ARATH|nr:uncharacterized protein AT1G08165 [Arabidopsis thaliana]KAG7596261.1 hypothetical protein ISN44_As06g007470 [Arabidopsis suecica]KAG7645524.1 hypothetical protein ISN45_At01g007690 [Arabidopsis thaliana x Arabidopsis arenosa]AEE28256.1 hypothetical protein AT1G08165 [Arabidopsis thaliana]CAA0178357.1 unnamed protein product [Arabidopsis thaliana]VYS45388.1 unnamed protein product [Arabidopsis thaliana]|eukprot:NP_001117246.1 hypothetical protein AT1G08165 [Arabidopsis thaliana]
MNYDRHLSPGAGSMANNKSKVEPKTHEEDLRSKGSPTPTIGYNKKSR